MTTIIPSLKSRARVFAKKRLAPLSLKLLYKDPVRIYIAALEGIYNVHYVGLREICTVNHHGVLCIIRVDDDIVICRTLLLDGHDLTYQANEIPSSVCRVDPMTFQIDAHQVIGHLCLEE